MAIDITLRPTYKQHLVYEALRNKNVDTIFFGGGAGGGKTWQLCESRLVNALRFPGYRSFLAREELKRLMQSTYITWVKVCQYHKIPPTMWKLNGQYNYIEFTNGSRIDLLDVKLLPTDPMYERLGSLEYTDGALEEAGEIHFLAYDVLKSRIGRHKNKEFDLHPSLLITGNPKKNWTYTEFYKPFRNGTLPPNHMFIQALYNDNWFTALEYGKQLSQIKDVSTKQRLMYGNWEYETDDNALMSYDAICDLFTNKVPEVDEKYLIVDVARMGKDKTVLHLWEGDNLVKRFEYEKQGIDETANRVIELLDNEQIPRSHCLVDEDGIGGGVTDIVRGVKGFHANATPFDDPLTHTPDNFQNMKTQCAYKLCDKVNEHALSVSLKDILVQEKIKEELEQIKAKDKDKDGKRKIAPKEEVKELIGRSPDDGDCFIMRMWFEFQRKTGETAHVHYAISSMPTNNAAPNKSKTAFTYIPRL
jgi:hypothetical protein